LSNVTTRTTTKIRYDVMEMGGETIHMRDLAPMAVMAPKLAKKATAPDDSLNINAAH